MRNDRHSIVLLSLVVAGLLSFGVWQLTQTAQLETDLSDAQSAPQDVPENLVQPATDLNSLIDELNTDGAALGSMQARLLLTPEGNRNNIFLQTIRSADYECPQIRTARLVGSDGALWRVQCGELNVYMVSVGEFGNLSAHPIPYGDMRGQEFPLRQFSPPEVRTLEEFQRTIRLPNPEPSE